MLVNKLGKKLMQKHKLMLSDSLSLFFPMLTISLCHLLKTFANNFDPDQAQRNVAPDLDPNCLTLRWYS